MRLIDADQLIEDLRILYSGAGWDRMEQHFSLSDMECNIWLQASIKMNPEICAEPVRHGRWEITEAFPHNVYCSECHNRYAQTQWSVWGDGSLPRNYCPNCGAKMDGERRESE